MRSSIMQNVANLALFLFLLLGFTSCKPADKPAVKPVDTPADKLQNLIICLTNYNSHVRRDAADGLIKLGETRAFEPFIACLKDQNPDVRGDAAEALGKLGDSRAVSAYA